MRIPGKARVLPPAENLLDRFTSRARRALALARAQAEEHGARSIQSGHLLAALVETEPQWGAVWTGADEPGLEALQRAVRMAVQAANEPAEPPAGEATAHLPRSELFMASLRRALQFADRERHPVVDLGHLLGGLCLLQDGSARAALGALGVEAPGVLARLGAYFDAPATRDTWAREVARRQAPRTLGKRGFTEAGALAVDRAKQVCLELRHNHLDTEHLLLGVLRVPTGEAALGLQRLGLDPETLVTRVGTYLRSADWNQTIRELPLTLLAREALELARGEARRLDRDRIGTAELLAGLLAVDDGLAAQVLIRSGMTLERWRNTLEQIAVAADPDAGPAVPESRSAVGGAWMKATIKWEGGSVELEFVECRVQAKGPDIGRMDLVAKKPLGLEWPSALAKALELFLRIKAAGEETEKKGLSHELPGNEIVVHYPGAVEGGEAKVPASVELLWTKYEGDRAKLGSVPCVKFVPDLAPEGAGCMGLLVAAATVGLATGVAAQHLL
ncbi:MAG: hypothetical protein M5U26_14620 [Planctomycetota bacterium]|nr:hypothetical protein [Planctomycetota bacterium]